MRDRYFAHTLPPPHTVDEWEPLRKHLDDVAARAAEFAGAFGAAEWGRAAGSWHDLGKYSDEFQRYLFSSVDAEDAGEEGSAPGRVDHSTFGARHAATVVGKHRGLLLAFCIAGHHAGLADAVPTEAGEQRRSLEFRLSSENYEIPSVNLPGRESDPPNLLLPPFRLTGRDAGFQVAFFTRMLFSALVDADRLATEAFCDPALSAERCHEKPSLERLLAALGAYLECLESAADPTAVNGVRSRVLADCVAAAPLAPGFFSLNVPTGGGKTLSSLAFALRHALAHGLRRVVVAEPFTTIIEQTAEEYRKALGALAEGALVEHHTNIRPARDTLRNQLAAENWDAPLIVTTNVQLYESLFASAPGSCRKLHRLAKSVIVLDEAQTVPVELLHPTLSVLRELVDRYGCSVVLCTATQPALERREGFDIGIDGGTVRAIARDTAGNFDALRRVQITHLGKLSDEDLAEHLAEEPTALCVVNTRLHASRLYDALVQRCDRSTCFHLSTLMCAQHRSEVLAVVRRRLSEGRSCRLVSTQLVEAGVNIDFPAVYRAPAGFDSIAQAAGRCNREGRLPAGKLCLFDTEAQPPPGLLRHAAQAARELADRFEDPLAPEAVEAYFRLFYWSQKHHWDRYEVLAQFQDDLRDPGLRLQFREAAKRYKIIRDEQAPVLVPHDGDAHAIRDRLLAGAPANYSLLRSAQRYIVGVWRGLLDELVDRATVIAHESGLWLLVNDGAYTSEKGLSAAGAGMAAEILLG